VLPYASLGSLFKGREAFLRRLRESLTRDKGSATAIVSKALYGTGGIGKTRAAVEYAWAYREVYTALLFAQADSPEELRRNLAGLGGSLSLPERDATEEEVRLEAVLAWLATHPGWLPILDNIDEPPALAEVDRLMGRLAGGHVILTSRLDRFALQVEPLEIHVLSLDAAAAFLLEATDVRRRKMADDEAEAPARADPGAGGGNDRQIALRIPPVSRNLVEQPREGGRLGKAGDHRVSPAVAATWQTSVDQLSETGRNLPERLAFLAPDPVPVFPLDVAVPEAEAEDPHEPLTALTAVSLVTREIENERFAVHRLVQDVTRRSLDAAASRQRVAEALGWVNAAFTGNPEDVRSWERLDPLAPHARSVTQWGDRQEIAEPTARLMNQLGALLYTKSLHTQAEPLYRRALAIDEATLGPEHPHVASCLNNLAALLQATNRLAEAEPLMRRALTIGEKNFGRDHPTVAIRLNNPAEMLRSTNRLVEAESLYRRALAVNEASLGPAIPISQSSSTTSPNYCEPPTVLPRPKL
jgi:tetratricopeptide (TPR) repeat protein